MNNIPQTNKWLILISFSCLIGMNQILWLTFAPILITTQDFFAISEFKANILTSIFPIIYVIFSIHSGKMIDEKGYKKVVSFAGLIMLVGSGLRFLGLHIYWIVLVGQILIAISQPYILNALNKIITDWFEANEINKATGISIGVLYGGTLIGAFIPPILIKGLYFEGMLLINFFMTLICFLFFISAIKENNFSRTSDSLSIENISILLKNKTLWILSLLIFVAFGYFNGISNWIAPIIEPKNLSELDAGKLTAFLVLGGIFGSITLPILSSKIKNLKLFLILAILTTGLFTYPIFACLNLNSMLGAVFALGFILLGSYPLILIATEFSVRKEDSAKSLAFLEFAGNFGGFFIIFMMEFTKNITGNWHSSLWVLVISMLIALPFAFLLKIKNS